MPMYIDECKRMNIQILKPDINESDTKFTVSDNKIRFGLGTIKNVGIGVIDNIVKERKVKEINTTFELVDIIKKSLPVQALREKGHPAKRTFQAIRIEVNDELGVLRQSVEDFFDALMPGGRLAIITFHSLEDRIVKTAMALPMPVLFFSVSNKLPQYKAIEILYKYTGNAK